jgi:hypothetical protein
MYRYVYHAGKGRARRGAETFVGLPAGGDEREKVTQGAPIKAARHGKHEDNHKPENYQ